MNIIAGILILPVLVFVSAMSFGCFSDSGSKQEYGEVVSFSKGTKLQFTDFVLEYMGERSEKQDFPNGNSFTFTYYDFKITDGTESKTISWSPGTGVIDPAPFEFRSAKYELELRNSEQLKKKLDDDELVIVKK